MQTATPILRTDPGPRVIEYAATQVDHQRRFDRRDGAEYIVEMAQMLPPDHRRIIEWRFRDGDSNRHIARRIGRSPQFVDRMVIKLLKHISSPGFRLLVRHPGVIPARHRKLAEQVLFQFRMKQDIAEEWGVSRSAITKEWGDFQMMAKMLPILEAEARRLVGLVRQSQPIGGG